jgi:8-oxo-dGTP pyrophosphatase MutT (NUDIX family)
MIYASGGVVFNDNKLLMIYRNGFWDLPKGKMEINESELKCAVREVEEECGINKLSVIKFLKYTYHTYVEDGQHILKKTSWYLMSSDFKKKLIPQKSEGISMAIWVSKNEIRYKLDNSFENIKDLLNNI